MGLAACGGGDSLEVGAVVSPEQVPDRGAFIESGVVPGSETPPPEALAIAEEGNEGDEDNDDVNSVRVDSPPSPEGVTGVHSVLLNGELFLRGSVPSEETAESVIRAAEEVFGEGNVVNEYSIDSNADFDPAESQAIFLADAVLFETNSAEVTDDFVDVLSFIPVLLDVQPEVTIWAFGHTDSVGNAEANLRLSQQRVDAVHDFVIELGGDGDRFFPEGRGEEEPIADNDTEEGRAQNRRVEFIFDGFDIDR